MRLRDGLTFDESLGLAADECAPLTMSGRIACRSSDGTISARFTIDPRRPDVYRFRIRARRLPLQPPFAGPMTIKFTNAAGIDRVASAEQCTGRKAQLTCRSDSAAQER